MAAQTPPERTTSERLTGQARAGLSGMGKVFAGFKEFVSRGNAVDLAVGVVIGAAFGAVITTVQQAFIGPLIGWVFGKPDLANLWAIGPWSWREGAEPIRVGAILDVLVTFLITAAAIYFLIVLPLNALARRRAAGTEPEPEPLSEDTELLREIRDLLAVRERATAPSTGGPPASPASDETATDEDAANPPGTLPPSFPPAG